MRRAFAAALALFLPTGASAAADSGACPAGVEAPARLSLAELHKRYGAADDQYMTIDGVELRYRDEGRGPVLLMLHGSRSTLNAWDGVTDRLKSRYRILRFDQPPGGLSGSLSDASIAAIGAPEKLVARFLDRLKVDKVTLVGVSSGGTMAYYFAGSFPDRVEALVLSNTPSDSVADAKFAVPPALDAATRRSKELGVEGRAFWSSYLTYLYGEAGRMKPGLVDYYCTTNLRMREANPFGLHALTANKARTAAQLAAVRAPVLILWGMRDPVLTPPAGRALLDYLKNASSRSFVAMDSVGHYPPMESPVAVAELIESYLGRNR